MAAVGVDKVHSTLVDASKSSQRWNVEHPEYVVDKLNW
jgi:hypothetical protein